MVESPEGSPERDRGAMIIQTGLSPLMQKVRLKRKHEDQIESEEEEGGEHGLKRQKTDPFEEGNTARQNITQE